MKVASFQIIGKRSRQEDSYFISEDLKLFAVCDGVGGSSDGYFASNHITELIAREYYSTKIASLTDFKNLVSLIINSLFNVIEDDVATTLTLLYIKGEEAYISYIGDSRVYYISKTKNQWTVTKDHSFVQELFEAGVLTSETEMRSHPMRNRITKAISSKSLLNENDIELELVEALKEGDHFVIASDGVFENYSHQDIVDLFTDKEKSIEKINNEMEINCMTNSHDNSTCILIEI